MYIIRSVRRTTNRRFLRWAAVSFAMLFLGAAFGQAASIHATECLVAVRRGQLAHRELPRDVKSAIQGSPLNAVPVDPYDGKPMRLALLHGQPVVYSVGRDGKDDGGQVDSDRDPRPSGDLIYRLLPAVGR
jgi:hypothetical protein